MIRNPSTYLRVAARTEMQRWREARETGFHS